MLTITEMMLLWKYIFNTAGGTSGFLTEHNTELEIAPGKVSTPSKKVPL